ncbi:TetR/AcrR family transcriptional regulator [Mycobacterium paraseoulense]|uniref:TetR family transcriptional regulator n=1 Tax=Mycobacterium paraseoulense TaxID=590652 RepID=A0A1X0IC97_9MYCO|nr:TetR/AcrR family transcriptional regulator [Mycobacterium paraseoulense]MCV7396549.1 TetR family transcriptional regulator [Mycobacterium paraseoulense]ORB42028.1 TetR family transcriptional regulator [Mycobacterium paraseoulense]BBZ72451.1 TetR family transcriptional regulator [Mycobacterium paraseoulense]
MTSPARGESLRDRQRAQVRADLRRAAFRLFVDRGYDAVTTEEIAAAAGVSPRTFFRHVPTKEDLLLAPVRHGGAAIVNLLEQRPATEAPDVALINAIITRTRSFEQADTDEWREALLVAPDLLRKVTVHTPADKERAAKLIAERMGVNPDVDLRPGLLVQLAFAAADFGFQQWVRQAGRPWPLDRYVTEALQAVKSSHWKRKRA